MEGGLDLIIAGLLILKQSAELTSYMNLEFGYRFAKLHALPFVLIVLLAGMFVTQGAINLSE